MGKALDLHAGGPRFKSHLSQYLPNFYWNFLKSGITGHGQIMCFFEILRSRAFRICGQSVWELKIDKIRRQGTVTGTCSKYLLAVTTTSTYLKEKNNSGLRSNLVLTWCF